MEILNTLNILSGSFIIYSLKRAISGLIFILLLVFYYSTKITLGVLLALLYKQPVSIDRRNFSFHYSTEVKTTSSKLISRVVKESSDSLFFPLFPFFSFLDCLRHNFLLLFCILHALLPIHRIVSII